MWNINLEDVERKIAANGSISKGRNYREDKTHERMMLPYDTTVFKLFVVIYTMLVITRNGDCRTK